MKPVSRRFIAAACCPCCSKQDVLYFVAETGGDFACVECGYESASNNQSENIGIAHNSLTRDNVTNSSYKTMAQEIKARPLKIIDSQSASG